MEQTGKTPAPKDNDSLIRQFGMFGIVLGQFLGASGAGVALGWVLWKKAGFPWWILLVTSLLGLSAASYQVIRLQRALNKREGTA